MKFLLLAFLIVQQVMAQAPSQVPSRLLRHLSLLAPAGVPKNCWVTPGKASEVQLQNVYDFALTRLLATQNLTQSILEENWAATPQSETSSTELNDLIVVYNDDMKDSIVSYYADIDYMCGKVGCKLTCDPELF